MSNKECFIKKIDELLNDCPDFFGQTEEAEKALAYFEELKSGKGNGSKEITENGLKVLQFMQENYTKYNNIFKAKEIAEGLFTSGKSVSGSMRKLVSDGFVEKIGKDPVSYAITEKGKSFSLT
jgi:predicted transcriptional regulator